METSAETSRNKQKQNPLMTHIPSTKHSVKISDKSEKNSKLSVIKQKPVFKSRRKANPQLSQKNKISNYFSFIGTIDRGRGGVEGESGDLDNMFSSTRQECSTRTKYI